MTKALLIVNHTDHDMGMQFYLIPNPTAPQLEAMIQIHGRTLDLNCANLPMLYPEIAEGLYFLVSGELDQYNVITFTPYTVSEAGGVDHVYTVTVMSDSEDD